MDLTTDVHTIPDLLRALRNVLPLSLSLPLFQNLQKAMLNMISAGSGKTRIAVELAGQQLKSKPQAKVVFLATTVALAQQQAGEAFIQQHSVSCTIPQLMHKRIVK